MSGAEAAHAARRWAESGLLWLTGSPAAPPALPSCVLPVVADDALAQLASLAPRAAFSGLGGAELLAERAACTGLARRGRVAPGGACHLLEARGGWLAANLPRADDARSLAAWLEDETLASEAPLDDAAWREIAARVATRERDACVARARLLGLAVAPADPPARDAPASAVVQVAGGANAAPRRAGEQPLVVELASLWAGPLAGRLLGLAGARVIKIEAASRPDGARGGDARFFDLLNAGKESLALDFRDAGDLRRLAALLARADIVIEGSRPRALAQLGIDAERWLTARPGRVWLSITGYGRSVPEADWIAFGDDAAAAAGLCWCVAEDAPLFVGDAIADPLTGLHGALAALRSWRAGEGALLDAALARTVAWSLARGPRLTASLARGQSALPPRILAPERGRAAPLGAHTRELLRKFGIT